MPAALELVDSSPVACSSCSCSCVRKSRGDAGGERGGRPGRDEGEGDSCADTDKAASVDEWLGTSLQS